MDTLKVPCPIHFNEPIRGVSTNHYAIQEFYCFQCTLQRLQEGRKVETILNLIDTVADYYQKNKQGISPDVQIPDEYIEIVSQKAEKMEKLNQQIESEKCRIITVFEEVSKSFNHFMKQKKTEYLNTLDQQLVNLNNWYKYFEKNIKKTFPTQQDISSLFPSKENLMDQLTVITDLDNLKTFIREVKEDLDEDKGGIVKGDNLEEKRKAYLSLLEEEIRSIIDIKPTFEQVNLDVKLIQNQLQNQMLSFLERSLVFKNPISDDINLSSSQFVTQEEFRMVQGWLPKELTFCPKLLYRGSRDGFNGEDFHSYCDGKENTITFIQVQFSNSENHIIGGYLNEKWHSSEAWIRSDQAFIFSTTSKVKCSILNNQPAAYGQSDCGPHLCDIVVGTDMRKVYLDSKSYLGSANFPEYQLYLNNGSQPLELKEIEVYTVN